MIVTIMVIMIMMIVIINMIMTMIIILGLYNLQSIATVHTNIYHLIATGCYRMIERLSLLLRLEINILAKTGDIF